MPNLLQTLTETMLTYCTDTIVHYRAWLHVSENILVFISNDQHV